MKHTTGLSIVLLLLFTGPEPSFGQEIRVDAGKAAGRITRHLTGACIEDVNHEIYGGLYSQMVFGEHFQEPPPVPNIAGFKRLAGNWTVVDGVVRIQAADGPKLISDRAAFRDGTVGVEVKFADRRSGNAGLIASVNRAAVGADNWIGYEIALNPSTQKLLLARHRHNFEPIQEVECPIPTGRWVPLEVRRSGTVLEILVDGKSVLKHDDGGRALAAGSVGLRAWQREASFRGMWVKQDKKTTLPFQQDESLPQVSGMWRSVQRGQAQGSFKLVADRPFIGLQSQQITFTSGEGEWGIENQGLNRWGMNFVRGRAYEGLIRVRAEQPTELFAALESRDGSRTYAETKLTIDGQGWQRIAFQLAPNGSDAAGRFTLKLKHPGSATLGYAFLQPGEWGRFKGLPVRRDVAEGMVRQGITVLRYGGSMVNHPEYRWKKMIGPRGERPPHRNTWYPYSSNGWGIVDFMNFCEAAGFESIPAFDINETPQDLADFIEYAKGSPDSLWGKKRVADGHPEPYRLPYIELGNEERVDARYAVKFEAIAKRIWERDAGVILVVGDFAYDDPIQDPMKLTGAASRIANLSGHARVLEFARKHGREVWFDVHLWTDGPGASRSLKSLPSYIDALGKLANGARHKVVVFEYNAGNHAMRRALGNALATNVIERDGRIPIVTSANGLQPDKQNDNGWDQGLLFLNPSQVWLQPPGYAMQMLSRNYLPQVVKCEVAEAHGLDATAKRSEDGRQLQLQIVNTSDKPVTAAIRLAGFEPGKPFATVLELAGPLAARNSAEKPNAIVPRESQWRHAIKDGTATRTFPAHSFTIIRWEN